MDSAPAPGEQPIVNILGQKVALGPHRRELLPLYLKWVNDFEVARTLAIRMRPMTMEAEEAWYTRITRSETDVVFTIYERAAMRPIGTTGLHRINHLHRTAEFGISIGEKDCWGRGYGTEATILTLDHGFNALGLHNILLTVYDHNE